MKTLNTTSQTTRLLGIFAALFGSVAFAAADDTDKFNDADADGTGTLNLSEFKDALSGHQPQKQVEKKFKRADTDPDSAVTLDEWLAYKSEIHEEKEDREKDIAKFQAADTVEPELDLLSYDEFIPTVPGKKPLIEVRKRFLRADTDADDYLSLQEWLDMKNDDMLPPVKRTKFDLADLNGDDHLDFLEFATTFPRKTKLATIQKKFDRENTNEGGEDNDYLTRDEWNPGGKAISDPA